MLDYLQNCAINDANTCKLEGTTGQLFLTLITTLIARKCTFLTPKDFPANVAPHLPLLSDNYFDFIIVGAGSAGAVVARRLAEADPNWNVLLIEAGGYPPVDAQVPATFASLLGDERYDWTYKTEPTATSCLGMVDGRCVWNRGKMLGGSSSMNAMMYVRGNQDDYDEWARLTKSPDWRHENVLRHFKHYENVSWTPLSQSPAYGKEGPLQMTKYHARHPFRQLFVDAYEQLGYDLNQDSVDVGFFECLVSITTEGRRASTAQAFLKPRRNLFIATETFATKIITETNKNRVANEENVEIRAEGVQVLDKYERKLILRPKKELIVSAGAINSPQLLMLSGIGPSDHLDALEIETVADLKVGYNLQDHFTTFALLAKLDPKSNPKKSGPEAVQDIFEYFNNKSGVYASIGVLNMLLFINSTDFLSSQANLQFLVRAYTPQDKSLVEFFKRQNVKEEILEELVKENEKNAFLAYTPILLRPQSRGRVLLHSTNPKEHPLIYSGYLTHAQDVQTCLTAVDFFKKLMETDAFAKYNPQFFNHRRCGLVEDDAYWECVFRLLGSTIYHPVGTCKMGADDDPESVVDAKLRVHGVGNLRVIDASIMPLITRGNTNAPTMMIGEMGAQFIVDAWKSEGFL